MVTEESFVFALETVLVPGLN